MINEIKVNVCLTLDVDSGMNKKDLHKHLLNNLNLKPHPFVDVVKIEIIQKLKPPINY